ncbi:MAG: DUF4231 domain-containing protein [Solirubrobacteraceae bacterium]
MSDSAEVTFPDGNRALVVRSGAGDSPRALLAAAGIECADPRAMVIVCGGADDLRGEELARARRMLAPAIRSVVALTGAAVIDGGTAAGVMRVVGEAWTDETTVPLLLGVAPAGKVALPDEPEKQTQLEPHHSHFVLADCSEWGCETRLLADLATTLAAGGPVAMVIAGGGTVTITEATEAARHGWPIFTLVGTGGVADELTRLWRRHRERRVRRLAPVLPYQFRYRRRRPLSSITDPGVREVVADGDLRPLSEDEAPSLGDRLAWEFQPDATLKAAWRRFATYDHLAKGSRKGYERLQATILILGILATFLALLQSSIGSAVLHWVVVAVPIVGSVVVAIANRRSAGRRWVLLRGATESVKSEIYRYRASAAPYDGADRAGKLAARIDAVVDALMHTDASSGPLSPYAGPMPPTMDLANADDGMSPLTPESYLRVRLASQLNYYHGRIRNLDRRRGHLQVIAISAGGAGAILAAAGAEPWIGLTSTIAAAAFSYLGLMQVDSTIVAYNQAAGRLETLRERWNALPDESHTTAAFGDLVQHAEDVLTTELGGWVEQMNESIRRQQEGQLDKVRAVDPKAASDTGQGPNRAGQANP